MRNLVSIIPAEAMPGEITRTRGTKVVMTDGTELQGVTRIVLTADVDDVWRAQIDVHPNMGVLPGVLAQINSGKVAWWRKALCRLAAVELDCTSLASEAREYDGLNGNGYQPYASGGKVQPPSAP